MIVFWVPIFLIDIVLSSMNTIVVQHFERFPRLLREAEYPIEDFLEEEFQKAEEKVQSQFKMEKIIYCQDSLYIRQQGVVQQQPIVAQISDVQNIAWNLNAYLTVIFCNIHATVRIPMEKYCGKTRQVTHFIHS